MANLMAVERIFDDEDISELLMQNSAPPLGARNAALIMGGVYWGLTPLELSLVSTDDVIAPNGDLYRIWVLPAHNSYNGEAREIYTEEHILPYFELYVAFRLKKDWGLSVNLHSHRGLNPESRFFLNDLGEPYALTERKEKPGSFQPRSMNEQLKRMIARTKIYGATPASFRDSYIKSMYEHGCKWGDLMKVSGIKQKRTLENKVRPHERELEQVLKSLFSRVKMPESLK
jgi:hypothetical protein